MTHTTKHTPGPWTAIQHPREHKWAWTIEGADGVGQSIARMGLVNDAKAVAANAHLIAAAPAMYEALKALHSVLDQRMPDGRTLNQHLSQEVFECFYGPAIAARAAIAKAEGA